MIGGGGSYNTNYGWYIGAVFNGSINIGFSEHNKRGDNIQVHFDTNLQNSFARIGFVTSGTAGVCFGNIRATVAKGNAVYYGGQYLGGGNSTNAYLFANLKRQLVVAENTTTGQQADIRYITDGNGNFTGEMQIVLSGSATH